MDNELLLYDRLEVIRKTVEKYGEENFYLAFSGGKDSTVLHHILDMAIPGNRIPRVFVNTGIEYIAIVQWVKQLAAVDNRIQVYNAGIKIKEMLEKVGYPFKSKEHAKKVDQWQRHHIMTKYIEKYLNPKGKTKYACPEILKYQFENTTGLRISHFCCQKLKKEPIHRWEKENGKSISITGLKRTEGGERANIKGCITFEGNKAKKFHPLLVISEEWQEWFIQRENIELCKLYYEPYSFARTGCKGCPFALDLQEQLEIMAKYLPAERKQCEIIWKPVYDEYRRLGYRLKPYESEKLF